MSFQNYKFEYKGHTCEVKANGMGHLCGYVTALNSKHPILVTGNDWINLECHGGITYHCGRDVGFDCAHSGDGQSTEYMNEENKKYYSTKSFLIREGRVWTPEEVEAECQSIVDQLIERRLFPVSEFKYLLRSFIGMLSWNFKTLWKETY